MLRPQRVLNANGEINASFSPSREVGAASFTLSANLSHAFLPMGSAACNEHWTTHRAARTRDTPTLASSHARNGPAAPHTNPTASLSPVGSSPPAASLASRCGRTERTSACTACTGPVQCRNPPSELSPSQQTLQGTQDRPGWGDATRVAWRVVACERSDHFHDTTGRCSLFGGLLEYSLGGRATQRSHPA